MENIFLSIIVPVYNAELYISKCIESIISQPSSNIELLLVNDGSLDGSVDICEKYAKNDSRIKVLHKNNGGVGSARNYGINSACGKYITFIDSDDWVTENYCETIQKEISDTDLLVFSSVRYTSNVNKTYINFENRLTNELIEIQNNIYYLKQGNKYKCDYWGYPWNKVYKRDIIQAKRLKFNTDLSFREDEIFNWEYAQHITSIKIINNVLYYYRILKTGLTSKEKDLNSVDWINMYTNLIKVRPNYISNTMLLEDLNFDIFNQMFMATYSLYKENKRWNYSFMRLMYYNKASKPYNNKKSLKVRVVLLIRNIYIIGTCLWILKKIKF